MSRIPVVQLFGQRPLNTIELSKDGHLWLMRTIFLTILLKSYVLSLAFKTWQQPARFFKFAKILFIFPKSGVYAINPIWGKQEKISPQNLQLTLGLLNSAENDHIEKKYQYRKQSTNADSYAKNCFVKCALRKAKVGRPLCFPEVFAREGIAQIQNKMYFLKIANSCNSITVNYTNGTIFMVL